MIMEIKRCGMIANKTTINQLGTKYENIIIWTCLEKYDKLPHMGISVQTLVYAVNKKKIRVWSENVSKGKV